MEPRSHESASFALLLSQTYTACCGSRRPEELCFVVCRLPKSSHVPPSSIVIKAVLTQVLAHSMKEGFSKDFYVLGNTNKPIPLSSPNTAVLQKENIFVLKAICFDVM